jgi:hypothetical protein
VPTRWSDWVVMPQSAPNADGDSESPSYPIVRSGRSFLEALLGTRAHGNCLLLVMVKREDPLNTATFE